MTAAIEGCAMAGTDMAREGTHLTHTCLKWTSDGELTPEDMQQVLNRLKDVEQIQRLRSAARPHSVAWEELSLSQSNNRPNLC